MKPRALYVAAFLSALLATSQALAQSGAPPLEDALVLGTVKSVTRVHDVVFTLDSKPDFKLHRKVGILTVAVTRCIRGKCDATIEVAVAERRGPNFAGWIGHPFLMGVQTKDTGRQFYMRPYMKYSDKKLDKGIYSTHDITSPYFASQWAEWIELAVADFDATLSPNLQLCDLFVRNAMVNPMYANLLADMAGNYRESKGLRDSNLPTYEAARSFVTSRFANDSGWRSKPERGLYLEMLLLWNDPNVVEECKAEIRRDPDCTLFRGGYPAIRDDALMLYVLRLGKPTVAQQFFEARGNPEWDKALLKIGLDRIGEDQRLDLKIFAALAAVTGDRLVIPSVERGTLKINPLELATCRDRARAGIKSYLGIK